MKDLTTPLLSSHKKIVCIYNPLIQIHNLHTYKSIHHTLKVVHET